MNLFLLNSNKYETLLGYQYYVSIANMKLVMLQNV